MAHVCQMVEGWFVVLGFGLSCQEQLQRQMAHHHMSQQLKGIGDSLKSMVKDEVEEDEEEGLGWGENVEAEEMEEVVEEDPPPFHNVWTKGDMAAVKAAAKEGKEKEMEKDVEVVESGEEDWEEDRETEKKKGVGGGGKSGGKERRVLAPWAKQRKKDDEKRDWVVKVDQWGGKRFNSGWYHYKGQWYPILVHDKVYKVLFQFERCCMGHLCEFTVFVPWFSIVMYLS